MTTPDRRWVTLDEFRESTALPEGAILWLLSSGAVVCRLEPAPSGEGHAVMVDLASLATEASVRALYESSRHGEGDEEVFLQERLASVVGEFLEKIYPEALELARVRASGSSSRKESPSEPETA